MNVQSNANIDSRQQLASALIEHIDGGGIPGVISLENRETCNNAVITADAPLTVSMPEGQWYYGLLLPFDHTALPSAQWGLYVRLHLRVTGGGIGIAGIDQALTRFTTQEHVVQDGEATVTINITHPQETHAVILRTVSSGEQKPEVTLLAASVHGPGGFRLAPRRHDLGHDLFVVLSMPKTASQTVTSTLGGLHPSAQVRMSHFISDNAAAPSLKVIAAGALPRSELQSLSAQIRFAKALDREIKCVQALGARIAIVSGVREPVARLVSSIFQLVPSLVPGFPRFLDAGNKLFEALSELVLHQIKDAVEARGDPRAVFTRMDTFLETEFPHRTLSIILKTPFDRERGFTLIEDVALSVLLYRYEDIRRALAPAIGALTGREDVELVSQNLSEDKSYNELYRAFLKQFKVPKEICSALYDEDQFIQHFYSKDEIESFKSRWTGESDASAD